MNPKKYINTLFEKRLMRHEIKRIQSLAHQIGIYNINKFFCHFLMVKDIYLMMELKLYHMDIKV